MKKKHETITSLDVPSQYSSVKYDLIEKAILYFAALLTAGDKDTFIYCLSLIKFGMGNTNIIHFKREYFKYGGSLDIEQ